jgi:hypothetical protein
LGDEVGCVGGFDWEVLLLAGVLRGLVGFWVCILRRRALPRLLLFSYWSFVFLVILLGVINYLLKFFIDSDNCIIRMLVPSIETLIVLGSRLNLDLPLADHWVAECLQEL